MKFIFSALLACLLAFLSQGQTTYFNTLDSLRQRAQYEMRNEVLDSAERMHFSGICYFTPDTNFRVLATFHKQKGKAFYMPMTKARQVRYRAVGYLEFTIRDTFCKLTLYQNLDLKDPTYKNYYFLPFKDGTTAISTYGAGRYLDVYRNKRERKIWLDFNKAYHPYCAYSDRYSCPIVPQENTITPEVLAGECFDNSHE